MSFDHPDKPHSGSSCIRVSSNALENWLGVSWQHPANDWGDQPGGLNLSGAKQLSFWARGERGGEQVTFGLGSIDQSKPYFDTAILTGSHILTTDWQKITIDLAGKNLSRVKTPFQWSATSGKEPLTFYLDDLVIE